MTITNVELLTELGNVLENDPKDTMRPLRLPGPAVPPDSSTLPGFGPVCTPGRERIIGELYSEMDEDGGGWTLVLASADLAHIMGDYHNYWFTSG